MSMGVTLQNAAFCQHLLYCFVDRQCGIVPIVLVAFVLEERFSVPLIVSGNGLRSANGGLYIIQRQFGKASVKSVVCLIVIQIFKVLAKYLVNGEQVLASVAKRTVAVLLMQHHPEFKGEIAITQMIVNPLVCLSILHFRQDGLEL